MSAAVQALAAVGDYRRDSRELLGDLGMYLFDTEEQVKALGVPDLEAVWRPFARDAHRWMARRVLSPQLDTPKNARSWIAAVKYWRGVCWELRHG